MLKKAILPILVLLAVVTYHTAAGQKDVVVNYIPTLSLASDTVEITGKSYVIFNADNGTILSADNENEVLPIASVTKLFAAAVVLSDAKAKDKIVSITANDVASEGHSGRLQVGQEYTAYELLFPLLLESSNDAALALERGYDTDLIAKMNDLASEVGASNLTFKDASGLSEKNTAKASDLALVTADLYKKEPHLFDITTLSKWAGPHVGFSNNSPVLQPSYQGGKHGYTPAAGKTLVAIYEEQFTNDVSQKIGYVILGSTDLVTDLATLREFTRTSASFK